MRINRNVLILSIGQALGFLGAPMVVLLGGIIGAELAPRPTWATLPGALLVVGAALATVPAALVMQRIGRRAGYMAGSLLACLSALLAAFAIAVWSFPLFCVATLGIGANLAFVQQYRFGAAESVEPVQVGRAVSLVLIGGVVAAFLGPELAKISKDWLAAGQYVGSFVALAGVYVLNAVLLSRLVPAAAVLGASEGGEARPLAKVVADPLFLMAVMAAMIASAVMAFIMTATPVSMHVLDKFSLDDTAWVIQSHVMAMFLPSFFSGALIGRFGLFRVMLAGILLMTFCVLIALVDRHLFHYWAGLVLLGIGWNFLFVGGTTLLTRSYRPAERFKAQAVNELIVYGSQAAASLSAGSVIFRAGWETVNLLTLPCLAAMLAILLRARPRLANNE